MKWLWRLVFWGRLRRIKRIHLAAALVSQGNLVEAEKQLIAAKPTKWFEDLAVYHFVLGKLRLEQGNLDEAEQHLYAAISLGLDRPSVRLNLIIIYIRRCQLTRALDLLDDVESSEDELILEQAKAIRKAIQDVQRGNMLVDVVKAAERFRIKHSLNKQANAIDTLRSICRCLRDESLSGKDRDDAAILLGELLVKECDGRWLFGLESRDHQVLIEGLLFSPCSLLVQLAKDQRTLPFGPTSMMALFNANQ